MTNQLEIESKSVEILSKTVAMLPFWGCIWDPCPRLDLTPLDLEE